MPPLHEQLDDETLLTLVRQGDESALGALYDRYGRVAHGLALRMLRDPALAQDAVQDAFLAVWRTAVSFDASRGAARTWLLTIVHRRAVDLVRREERQRTDLLPPDESVDAGESTDEAAWIREERRNVQTALAGLPTEQRQLLELAYYGGLSQAEIADRLGLPLGTVKSRMFAALSRLRVLLAGA